MSTEASGGSWLNHADGNQAAPGCGLMLSPHLSKLSCLTLLLGKLKVFKGQLALPNNSTECKEHTFFPPPSDSRHSHCRIAQMIFLNLGCFIWLLILIQRASHNAVLLKTVLILVFYRFSGKEGFKHVKIVLSCLNKIILQHIFSSNCCRAMHSYAKSFVHVI